MSEKVITEAIVTFLWMCGGLIPARLAWNKGRPIAGWWVLGAAVWPILILVVALVPPNQEALKTRAESPDPQRGWRRDSRIGLAILAAYVVVSLIVVR